MWFLVVSCIDNKFLIFEMRNLSCEGMMVERELMECVELVVELGEFMRGLERLGDQDSALIPR